MRPINGPRGEECLKHGVVNRIEPGLKAIDEFVQSLFDNIVDVGKIELRPQQADLLFGRRLPFAQRRTGDGVQRFARGIE